jgi:molybdopterin-guanine dinucleotide biosynthesis protein A
MGRDKALVEVDGIAMAKRVAIALEDGDVDPVVCVGGDQAALEALDLEWIPDAHPGEGPLGGFLTALEWGEDTPWDAVVLSACDLPFLDGETVENLLLGLIGAPLARPAAGPGGQPPLLIAANVAEVLPVVRDLFAGGERSFRWLGARLPVSTVHPIDPQRLRDVDRPEDLP